MALVAAAKVSAQQSPAPTLRAIARDTVRAHPTFADEWFAPDKAKHFTASAIIQIGAYFALRAQPMSKSASMARASTVTAAVGIGKELWDATGRGDASWKDLAWDGFGLAAGAGLAVAVDRRH